MLQSALRQRLQLLHLHHLPLYNVNPHTTNVIRRLVPGTKLAAVASAASTDLNKVLTTPPSPFNSAGHSFAVTDTTVDLKVSKDR